MRREPAKAEGSDELAGRTNYLIGRDPKNWHTDVPTFRRVKYSDVYKGIDVEYYGNQRHLEYDFRVQPGADHRQIVLEFDGADSITLDHKTGDVLVDIEGQTFRQLAPYVYQEVQGERLEVQSGFVLDESDRISIQIADYDRSLPLVIDPVLMYSTFLGGTATDTGNSIAVDSFGNAYVTGRTSSTNFPTAGAIQQNQVGYSEIFVTKINAAGSAIVYSTYLGGNGGESGKAFSSNPR